MRSRVRARLASAPMSREAPGAHVGLLAVSMLLALLAMAAAAPLTGQATAPDTTAAASQATSGNATAGFATPPTAADTSGGAGLSGAALDAETAQVAAQLRCPVCRGQSVLESTATLSKEIQAEIKQRLASGQSPAAVKAYFVSRYGEWILLKPPTHGLSLLVWVLPGALLVGGLGVAWLWIRSRRGKAGADGAGGGTGAAGLSEEERRWLDRAMRDE